jgi:Holliday junction DNA helicase RuvA
MHDAVLALITLGYKQVEAHKAVKRVVEIEGAAVEPEVLVRKSLQLLTR